MLTVGMPALTWKPDISPWVQTHLAEVPLAFLHAIRRRNALTVDLSDNPLVRPPPNIVAMGSVQAISWWEEYHRFGKGVMIGICRWP